ncbi:MAG: DUF2914 domain-containing protein [bacterium]|nr:DUF2914 domain-containing protein [Myxococcales bacterium]MCB9553157.1 DUF2914 domain-containing protein [Myxococcales bacterium]
MHALRAAAFTLALLPLAAFAGEPQAPAPAEAAAPIALSAIATGTAIEDRALVGEASRFELGAGRVYVYLELAATAPGTLEMVWRRDDKVVQTMPVDVGKGRRWRTWSYRRLGRGDAGQWTVTVVDAEGRALGEAKFEVTGG